MNNREIDRLVAQHVMGWTLWLEHRGQYDYIIWHKKDREPWFEYGKPLVHKDRFRQITLADIDTHKHIENAPPEFSTDIAAAWQVVAKFGLTMTLCLVGGRPAGDWECELYTKGNPRSVEMEVANGTAKTAPLAICLAALQAVGVAVPEVEV